MKIWIERILISLVTVSWLCCCSTTREPDLTGRWLNDDQNWGLEFAGSKVIEWERDEIETKGSFTVTRFGDAFLLVVETPGEGAVSFKVEMLGQNRLRLTGGKEGIELRRQ